jgi:hypothetical protein
MSTAPGGGLYTGPASEPYRSNLPPWPVLVKELERRGYTHQAAQIRSARGL